MRRVLTTMASVALISAPGLMSAAFAHGGSHIADLGYFPLGNVFFTDLLHYVRSGDFVATMLARAESVDEYAFALGALSHYVTDDVGHPEATNRVVPEIYPALRMCLVCGYVGCCGAAKGRHMAKHYEATGHPIFRSIQGDDGWIWCYADDAFFGRETLARYAPKP